MLELGGLLVISVAIGGEVILDADGSVRTQGLHRLLAYR
jgi:hypothetical protein